MFYNGGRAGARKPHSGHYWRVVGLVTESSQTTGILRKQQGSVVAWDPGPLNYHRRGLYVRPQPPTSGAILSLFLPQFDTISVS
jgi:hypothetical protein